MKLKKVICLKCNGKRFESICDYIKNGGKYCHECLEEKLNELVHDHISFPDGEDHYLLKKGKSEEVELYTYITCKLASELGKDKSWAKQ
jgi:hypothetical protein